MGDGFWPLEIVTEERRHLCGIGSYTVLHTNYVFTVISVDDVGPYDFYMRSYELPTPDEPRRWHVVLVNDVLAWFDHGNFAVSSLIRDVP